MTETIENETRGDTMRIQTDIDVDVAVHYLDIEGLRFNPYAGSRAHTEEKVAQWDRIRATMQVREDGSYGPIYVTGAGKFIKKDGTVGLQPAKINFGRSLRMLPEEWQERITADLKALADKVTISE